MLISAANVTKLFQLVPSVAATTSFAVLSLAFVHEWAFYGVIGTKFQHLMGITDYFNSAIDWLPWIVLGYCIAMIFRLSDSMRNVGPDVKATLYKRHPVRWVIDSAPTWAFIFTAIVGGGFQFLFGDWYAFGPILFLFILCWIVLLKYLVTQEGVAKAITNEVTYVLAFGPVFLFFAFWTGASDAAAALVKKEPSFIGRLKNQYQERDWIVLRTLANGLIVRDLAGERIQFLRWDDIGAFQKTVQQPNRNGLVCRVSGYVCH